MNKDKLLLTSMLAALLSGCGPSETTSESKNQDEVNMPTQLPNNSLSDKEKREGWKLLFDGNTAQGWHTYLTNNPPAWEIREGELFTPGKRGDIVTDEEFENFELLVDWKIEAQGNSGIFYHVVEHPDYPRMHETGPEFQIIDDENYPQQLTENQTTGSNSDVKGPSMAASNPPGDWNQTRIRVDGGHVTFWLNGNMINEYDMESAEWKKLVSESKFAPLDYAKVSKGRIGLQDHGGPVWFKNIKIKVL